MHIIIFSIICICSLYLIGLIYPLPNLRYDFFVSLVKKSKRRLQQAHNLDLSFNPANDNCKSYHPDDFSLTKNASYCYEELGRKVIAIQAEYQLKYGSIICKSLSLPSHQFSCASGFYSEFIKTIHRSTDTMMVYPCSEARDFPAACYRHIWDFPTIGMRDAQLVCLSREDKTQREACFHGMGYTYSFRIYQDSGIILPINQICSVGDEADQSMCIYGYWWGLPEEAVTKISLDVCSTFTSRSLETVCRQHGNSIGSLQAAPTINIFFPLTSPSTRAKSQQLPPQQSPFVTDLYQSGKLMVHSKDVNEIREIAAAISHDQSVPLSTFERYYSDIGINALLHITESQLSQDCHFPTHNIGKVAFNRTGNLVAAMHLCGRSCNSACFHGALFTHFSILAKQFGSREELRSGLRPYFREIVALGSPYRKVYGANDLYHSFGHVIMMEVTNHNISMSIEVCKTIGQASQQYSCAVGVYHQYILFNKTFVPNGFSPCDKATEFAPACYKLLWHKLKKNITLSDAHVLCTALDDDKQRQACFHGIGNCYSQHIVRHTGKPLPVDLLCQGGRDIIDRKMCVFGSVSWPGPFQRNKTVLTEMCQALPMNDLGRACLTQAIDAKGRDAHLFYNISSDINSTVMADLTHY